MDGSGPGETPAEAWLRIRGVQLREGVRILRWYRAPASVEELEGGSRSAAAMPDPDESIAHLFLLVRKGKALIRRFGQIGVTEERILIVTDGLMTEVIRRAGTDAGLGIDFGVVGDVVATEQRDLRSKYLYDRVQADQFANVLRDATSVR